MEHMTAKECASYLKIHVNTLRKYVHEEGLPVLKFPGRRAWRFRKDLVDAWSYERSQPEIIQNGKTVKEKVRKDYGKLRVLMPN